ncbi:MAG: hypothetical protein GEV10_11200 [Streptosporangiales bacterium]|nr:hypothetical protein [Streptosporangiales bacterium]
MQQVSTRSRRYPLRPLVAAVGVVAVLTSVLLGVGFVRSGPFVPTADREVSVVVRDYVRTQSEVRGPPRTRYEYRGSLPAAVLDLDGVTLDRRTYRAIWYDTSGDGHAYVESRRKKYLAQPIPVTTGGIAPQGTLTFVFGPWDTRRDRFVRIDARTQVTVVDVR